MKPNHARHGREWLCVLGFVIETPAGLARPGH
jgi:hypothetical protein